MSCSVKYKKGALIFSVVDEGIGISDDDQARLFARFERMDNAHKIPGSGLGLSISKQLVELMDGSIKLKSKLQEGTRVSISIPSAQMDQNQVAEASPQSASAQLSISKPVNILIVEDHPINQAVIAALFEKLGLAFTIVDTGEEGVEYIKSNHADLVLMDINLPGIQGDQASRLIKAQYPNLPIVALTADAITTSDSLKERGLDDVLTKPINAANLVKVLNHFLG